ncbi:hypothetical protein Q3G72_030133 [Acer saccharum]|nr:hypothetical protein Q3G72_030133 [Acer saccharum]
MVEILLGLVLSSEDDKGFVMATVAKTLVENFDAGVGELLYWLSGWEGVLLARNLGIKDLDRFIPNRSSMDFDYTDYMLTDERKGTENPDELCSPWRVAYHK